MLDTKETTDGIIVPVRAQPRARRNGVTGAYAGQVKIAVTEAPAKGKANDAISAILAEVLHVGTSQVMLVAGRTSTQKKFLIVGTTIKHVRDTLTQLVDRAIAIESSRR